MGFGWYRSHLSHSCAVGHIYFWSERRKFLSVGYRWEEYPGVPFKVTLKGPWLNFQSSVLASDPSALQKSFAALIDGTSREWARGAAGGQEMLVACFGATSL